ncbi:hypothetical protein IJL65_00005 [bacterium]|nr:hypothetical protein [bacterium]
MQNGSRKFYDKYDEILKNESVFSGGKMVSEKTYLDDGTLFSQTKFNDNDEKE